MKLHSASFLLLAALGELLVERAGLINIGGGLLCGIGVFVTLPWTLIALAYIYEDLFGTPRSVRPAKQQLAERLS